MFVDVDAEECRRRDPKGLYALDLADLPGASVPYERPAAPEVVARGGEDGDALDAVLRLL